MPTLSLLGPPPWTDLANQARHHLVTLVALALFPSQAQAPFVMRRQDVLFVLVLVLLRVPAGGAHVLASGLRWLDPHVAVQVPRSSRQRGFRRKDPRTIEAAMHMHCATASCPEWLSVSLVARFAFIAPSALRCWLR